MNKLTELHFDRCMRTNEGLMKLLNLSFHFERLQLKYSEERSVENTLILMTRARKMYEALGSILTIFKLVDQRKLLLSQEKVLLNEKEEEDEEVD